MTPYFEGWYFKHQTEAHTLCLIPGLADSGAFIQVITEDASYVVDFPLEQYHAYSRAPLVAVDENRFSRRGIHLSIHTPKLSLAGTVHYHGLTPLRHDIMGPFALLPMETHHTVVSMSHGLSGSLRLNGHPICFDGGRGYIEGDRGRSFPKQYAWVQCNAFSQNASIMLSIAQIPLGPARFWGCIGVVWLDGRECRFATYKGVRILRRSRERLEVAQGSCRLVVEPDAQGGHKLAAPSGGRMVRTIHENAQTRARFRFYEGERLLLDEESGLVGFEYVE